MLLNTNPNALPLTPDLSALSPAKPSPPAIALDLARLADPADAAGDAGYRRFATIVRETMDQGTAQEVTALIERLGRQLAAAPKAQQAPLLESLLNLNEALVPEGDPQIKACLARPLCHWVSRQGRLTPAYGQSCVALQRLANHLIADYRLAEANRILMLFSHIHSGALEKDATLGHFAGTILKGLSSDRTMDRLVEEFRSNTHNQCRDAGRSLVILGAVGIEKILPVLKESEDKFDRMRFLEVVAEMGPLAAEILVERLGDGGPWYFLRNLVQILGKSGDESQVDVLASLLTHEDQRVRREALDTIYKIGGAKREDLLLNTLPLMDVSLKIRAVAMLGNLRSRKALGPLLAMVGEPARIWDRMRRELDLMICHALGKIGASEAIPVLQDLAEKKHSWNRRAHQRLAAAARQALAEIGQGQASSPGARADTAPGWEASAHGTPAAAAATEALPARVKREVKGFIRQGNTKAAVKVIYDKVLELVDQRRFDEAGALRRLLVSIDPLAFNAIVKSGVKIDAARNAAIDPEHLAVWDGLYRGLTQSEANRFYYSLREVQFAPGEALVSQGESKACLYLINRGQVKTMFQRKGGAIQLNTLCAGDIGGYESFFHHTVATTSLIAAEPVAASCLNRRVVDQVKETFPHLLPKLHDFCRRRIKNSDLWLRKSIDRRTQRRIAVIAPVKLRLPDAQGRGIDIAYRGQLTDISVGGAALRVRLKRGDRTRMLVGRPVLLELQPPLSGKVSPSRRDAVVVALRPHLLEQHVLQIQFVQKIKLDEIQRIEELVGSL